MHTDGKVRRNLRASAARNDAAVPALNRTDVSALETLVLQLKASLAIAEAALAQGAADQPKVYTVADVAEIIGCSDETVRRRIRDGQLDAVTSSARWLISAPALDRYLSGDSSSSTAAA
jgi:excisionase family DNA binding protein